MVQVILLLSPTNHISSPSGAVTRIEPLISKSALDSSFTVASPSSVILTRS